MSVSVRLQQAELARLVTGKDGPVYRDLNQRANRVRNAAKRLAPVDRGTLRNSIQQEIRSGAGGLTARVGTNVEYAVYQEFGTKYMRAQPFLAPALQAARY